jgi:hypothetical protein
MAAQAALMTGMPYGFVPGAGGAGGDYRKFWEAKKETCPYNLVLFCSAYLISFLHHRKSVHEHDVLFSGDDGQRLLPCYRARPSA